MLTLPVPFEVFSRPKSIVLQVLNGMLPFDKLQEYILYRIFVIRKNLANLIFNGGHLLRVGWGIHG